jgi:hypothetical protein
MDTDICIGIREEQCEFVGKNNGRSSKQEIDDRGVYKSVSFAAMA